MAGRRRMKGTTEQGITASPPPAQAAHGPWQGPKHPERPLSVPAVSAADPGADRIARPKACHLPPQQHHVPLATRQAKQVKPATCPMPLGSFPAPPPLAPAPPPAPALTVIARPAEEAMETVGVRPASQHGPPANPSKACAVLRRSVMVQGPRRQCAPSPVCTLVVDRGRRQKERRGRREGPQLNLKAQHAAG